MNAFLLALSLLTLIPVHPSQDATDEEMRQTFLWYPVIGCLLGGVGVAILMALDDTALLASVMVVGIWAILTGGLHLDGLADCVDGLMGGMGNRRKTLVIMDDPHIGSMAGVALWFILSLKAMALYEIAQGYAYWTLLFVPVVARLLCTWLIAGVPCAKSNGMAAWLKSHIDVAGVFWIGVIWLLIIIVIAPFHGTVIIVTASAMAWGVHYVSRRWLGGVTGDILGASIEIMETASLVVLALAV